MKAQISKYFYPITPETLNDIVDRIQKAVKSKSNYSFFFNENIGGSRAWIRFITNYPQLTNFHKLLPTSRIAVFEPSDSIEQSSLGFFYQLLVEISNAVGVKNLPKYERSSLYSIHKSIKELINKIPKDQNLLLFIVKPDAFKSMDITISNLLYSIWKDNKDNLTFIFSFSKIIPKEDLKSKYGLLFEAINANVYTIPSVSSDDIKHSIMHWSEKLNHQFSNIDIENIVKYSNGSLYLSKQLCQEISQNEKTNIDKLCKSVVEKYTVNITNTKLSIKKTGNVIYLNKIDISRLFTYQEFSVLKLLVERSGMVVNRDDIAFALWGDKLFDKYSDWAIDKFVSLIRKKLKKLNFTGNIKVKKGEGFSLLQI
jgi:DNA-binding winged helix-turn-helix (wHTH) protein